MIDRAGFPEPPPEHIRLVWCDWLRRHAIDPADVAVAPGWVEVDTSAYRISYLSYDHDEHGRRYFDPVAGDMARVVRTVQLDARPSPLPYSVAARPQAEDRPRLDDLRRRPGP